MAYHGPYGPTQSKVSGSEYLFQTNFKTEETTLKKINKELKDNKKEMRKLNMDSPWFELTKNNMKRFHVVCNWKSAKEFQKGDILEVNKQCKQTKKNSNSEREKIYVRIIDMNDLPTCSNVLDMRISIPGFHADQDGKDRFVSIIPMIFPGIDDRTEALKILNKQMTNNEQAAHGVRLFAMKLIHLIN